MGLKNQSASLFKIVAPEMLEKYLYKKTYGIKCNLKNPKTFSEKVLWLKHNTYHHNNEILNLCDKFLVREYVLSKGLGDILNELYFVREDGEKINYDELPRSFVLKMSLGCGTNYLCKDKSLIDQKGIDDLLEEWRKRNKFYDIEAATIIGNMKRKDLKKYIVCEKLLLDNNGEVPADYKVYCFNGEPKAVLYMAGRFSGNMEAGFFDMNWKYHKDESGLYAPMQIKPQKPKGFDKMMHCAKKLSENLPFVRIDFYELDGEVVFGEMTFFPHGGVGICECIIDGKNMGELIRLPR